MRDQALKEWRKLSLDEQAERLATIQMTKMKEPRGYLDEIYDELVKIRKLLEGVFRERSE